jgi:serine/threonine-protein kinase
MELLDQLAAALGDRYRVERELGHGGMAVVFLAEDLKHRRPVAIKVLKPELSAAVGSERFLREIEIAATLQHPHILPLFDSGQVPAGPFLYYVMPFVEGESLRQLLAREQQLPIATALQITREVGSALQYAHEHGVIHRDIKPENIMMSGGVAVVADFGIARALHAAGPEQLTMSGIAIGTPQYMSPEQAGGSTVVDGRSDQYSLACALYEMLIGQPPFTGPTTQAVIARHLAEPVPSLRVVRQTVPKAMETAILRAMAKLPADRFASIQQFLNALEVPDHAEALAVPLPSQRRFARWARPPLMITLGVAVLAAATAWWLGVGPRDARNSRCVSCGQSHRGTPVQGSHEQPRQLLSGCRDDGRTHRRSRTDRRVEGPVALIG